MNSIKNPRREQDPDGQLEAAECGFGPAAPIADDGGKYAEWLKAEAEKAALGAEFQSALEAVGRKIETHDEDGLVDGFYWEAPSGWSYKGFESAEEYILHTHPSMAGKLAERNAERAAKAAAENQHGPIADGWAAKAEAALDRKTGTIPAELLTSIRALPQEVKRHLPRWLVKKL